MLAPIEGEAPGGVNLRDVGGGSSPLYALGDLRRAASAAERAMVMEDEAGVPEQWGDILRQAPDVLATQSKDLRIACWLVEAALRYHGFAGLRDGFDLLSGLIERYWDDLYPPVEDSIEDKTDPIAGLNGVGSDGALIAPIRRVLITDGQVGRFGLWQYEQANDLRKLTDDAKIQARIEAGATPYADFEKSVLETPGAFYDDLSADVRAVRDSFARLDALLTERCGADAPPTSNISAVLEQVADVVGVIMRTWNKGTPVGDGDGAEASDGGGVDAATGGAAGLGQGGSTGGPARTREQAFSQLQQIAEFFRRTEPQSFIPATLEEVVRRGRLPMDKLLEELIPDQDARQTFFIRVGVTPRDSSEE